MRPDAVTSVPVVGRAPERQALRRGVDAAVGGTGAVVLLTGPPGIGKTRVLEVLAEDAASAGVPVRWGRVAEEGAPPLWPWRRVLEALPEGGTAVEAVLAALTSASPEDAAAARLATTTALADALVASAQPAGLVVVLEDLHWADTASIALLRHLAADVRRSRLLVVGSSRDSGSLVEALPDLIPLPAVEVLELGPLSVAGVAAYLSAAAGRPVDPAAVALVHERSGGNPLYVRTLTRVLGSALLEGVPVDADVSRRLAESSELRHLVAAVLRPLDEGVRHVVAVAGVLGEEVEPALLAEVAELPRDQVDEALEAAAVAGLLTSVPDAPGRRRFAHALVRDGVRGELSDQARRQWHVRAATALEGRVAAQPHRAAEVATHWLRGADEPAERQRAVRWARRAAEQAVTVAPAEAARLLSEALAAGAPGGIDDGERAEVLVALATAEYGAGRMSSSLQHCRAAADAAEAAERADVVAAAALVVRGVGHPLVATALLELCDRALRRGPHPPATAARLLAQQALARAELGQVEPARRAAREALAAAEQCGDPQALLVALHAGVDTLDAVAPPQERRALAERALQVAPASGQPLTRLWAHLWRLDAAYQAGDPTAVDEEVARIEHLATDSGLPLARWHLLRVQAARHANRGRLAEARAANAEAGALALQLQDGSAWGMTNAFKLCLAMVTGDPADLGPDWLSEMAAAPEIPIVVACSAGALLLLGRREEAALRFAQVLPLAAELSRDGRWAGTLDALVEVAEGLGDVAAAEVLHDLLLPTAPWSGGPGAGNMFATGSGWRQIARMAAVAGRRDEAREAFERALPVDLRLGAQCDTVHVRLGLAELLAPDDPGRARRLAAEAAADARRIGMPGSLRRADVLLAGLSAAVPDPLSPREREVALLVAQSLSNREVAARLVLSERTVESHVRSILSKLGLSRRTDVVRWVLEDAARV